MKPIAIVTDSASDLTLEELARYKVRLAPMNLLCGQEPMVDDKTVPMARLWARMEGGERVTTSQPSPQTFLDLFEEARDRGEAVVCVLLSSALSGTYQAAELARQMAEYDEVYLVDSRAAAAAEKLLVLEACRRRDEGALSAAQLAAHLNAYRERIRLFACIDTLDYLVWGGRLTKMAGNIGSLLRIKPIITFAPGGSIQIIRKVQGLRRAMGELCGLIAQRRPDPERSAIPLFAKDDGNCRAFLAQLLQQAGRPPALLPPQEIGATIGCHIGPGGFGLTFVEACP